MNHDPLCTKEYERFSVYGLVCKECDIIARVREDERVKREADGPWFQSLVHECCERGKL